MSFRFLRAQGLFRRSARFENAVSHPLDAVCGYKIFANCSCLLNMLMPDLSTMPDEREEADEVPEMTPEEQEAALQLQSQMQDAMAFNAQLKEMLAQHEELERQRQQHQPQMQPGRPRAGPTSLPRGAAPPVSGSRRMAPPPNGHAKNGGWGGTTHNARESNIIAHENQILVQKLSTIAIKPTMNTQSRPFKLNPAKTSVRINQDRKNDQIARENARLAAKLNNVKPTAALSKKMADKHAREHAKNLSVLAPPKYGNAMAMLPPAAPPSRSRQPSASAFRQGQRPGFQL